MTAEPAGYTPEQIAEAERFIANVPAEEGPPPALEEALRITARRANGDGGGNEPGRRLILTPYSEIEPENTRWAWKGLVPLGAVTLLAGRQGLGKSTLLASLAADLSQGRLPGDLRGEAVTVLTASYEDAAPQVASRLLAAGADSERVVELDMRQDGHPDLLSLPADLDLIADAAQEHGARVLMVDPLMAALPGRVDSHRDQDVRRALAPLGQLAEDADLAVLAVLHLRKGAAVEALDRVSGSVAFTAAARSVLAFGRAAEEGEGPGRVLAHAKSNLGPLAPSLAYRVEPATVQHHGLDISTVRLVLDGECDVRAGELLSPPVAEDRIEVEVAAEWLADELANGEWQESREIKAGAKVAGIKERTLQRAMQRLGVEDDREGFPAISKWRLAVAPGRAGATRSGATGATGDFGSTESKAERSGSQSRQEALYGATEVTGGCTSHPDGPLVGCRYCRELGEGTAK